MFIYCTPFQWLFSKKTDYHTRVRVFTNNIQHSIKTFNQLPKWFLSTYLTRLFHHLYTKLCFSVSQFSSALICLVGEEDWRMNEVKSMGELAAERTLHICRVDQSTWILTMPNVSSSLFFYSAIVEMEMKRKSPKKAEFCRVSWPICQLAATSLSLSYRDFM